MKRVPASRAEPTAHEVRPAPGTSLRLLLLTTMLPAPPDNGHKLRCWAILRTLASLGHDVILLGFHPQPAQDIGGDVMSMLETCCSEVHTIRGQVTNLSTGSAYLSRAANLARGQAYSVGRFSSQAMQSKIRGLLSRHDLDAVVCDSMYGMINLPAASPPVVLNCDNVEHLILRRYLPYAGNPFKRLYARLESRALRRFEAACLRRAHSCLTCSEIDSAALARLDPHGRFHVTPNVIDLSEYLAPIEGRATASAEQSPAGSEPVILFQGGMDWYPNRDAVELCITEIMPRVRAQAPTARLVVAGRNPPRDFVERHSSHSWVHFTGTVPDMRPIISSATVCIVPLRIGSGTRLKILEAAAMEKAVVSTRLGAEGLSFVDQEEILLADAPEDLARAVIALLEDSGLRRRLGRAARRRVASRYDLHALQHPVSAALEPITGSRRVDSKGRA